MKQLKGEVEVCEAFRELMKDEIEELLEEEKEKAVEKGIKVTKMILSGKSDEEIMESVELTREELEKLKKKLEELEETEKLSEQKIYRVNPFCPHCGEEHVWFNIIISDEEQKKMDLYYKENENKSEFALLLAPPPLFVETEFRCPCCGEVFVAKVGIYRENALDYRSEKIVPMGRTTIF